MARHDCHASIACAQTHLESQIARFARPYRRRLRKLVKGSRPLADLLVSFPAAILVLAAGGRPRKAREEAVRLIRDGAALPAVAAALGVPLWMRRLPPEAFAVLPPEWEEDKDFGSRIVNFIPNEPDVTAKWLQSVSLAARACDGGFALWIASQKIFGPDSMQGQGTPPFSLLAAFAWFSDQTGLPGRGLIARPWHRKTNLAGTVPEASAWFERILFDYCRDENDESSGNWGKIRKVGGYRFVPLLSEEDLRDEGDRMANCVATYWKKATSGECLLYSVRRGGHRIATLEITQTFWASRIPVIAQLLGPANAPVDADVQRTAHAWLLRQGQYPVARKDLAQTRVHPGRWEEIWRPYREAHPDFGHEFAEPRPAALSRLRRQIDELHALAKIA
jgi:hypothetical protein